MQLKAMASGRPLKPVSYELARRASRIMLQGIEENARLHLQSIKCQIARVEPDFTD